ncbi:hypothetical protein LINGRAHAP2_LOCUS11218, partial [Linum grandiflorum]
RSWEAPLAYPCFLLLNKTSCFYFVFVCGLIWGWLSRPSLPCFFCVFSMCVEALIKMTTLSQCSWSIESKASWSLFQTLPRTATSHQNQWNNWDSNLEYEEGIGAVSEQFGKQSTIWSITLHSEV